MEAAVCFGGGSSYAVDSYGNLAIVPTSSASGCLTLVGLLQVSGPTTAGSRVYSPTIALGAGGMWGKGFLQGTQGHLNFLPEKQTDFIFTMIGEEFGLVGGLVAMGLLALIVLGGMAIALNCRHQFGRLVALGISFNFFMYVFVNIAMVMGVIPVGGVPLPMVSHGGSAMLTVMVGFGILMSVHVHRDVEFGNRNDDL